MSSLIILFFNKMLSIRDWSQLKSRASTIRDFYEKGGGIVFLDQLFGERLFLSLAVCPFMTRAFDDFSSVVRGRKSVFPPPYLYFRNEKHITRFFFFRKFEERIFGLISGFEDIVFVAVSTLRISHPKIGMRISRQQNISELLDILGGLVICLPIERDVLRLFRERADIVFIGDESVQGQFPTYVEAIDQNTIRMVYEGVTPKHTVAERLANHGIRVM